MYKVAYVTGSNNHIASILRQTIDDINSKNGEIVEVVQSQSSPDSSIVIVTITIIYRINRGIGMGIGSRNF